MIQRQAFTRLQKLASAFKAVAVTGPRQSGKTTLVKEVFPTKPYVSLENPDTRNFALTDPRGLLATYPNGAILDEVQRVPGLLSYLQEILDNSKEKGQFVLTGSNNFQLIQAITQSLAGRVGSIELLPFTLNELQGNAEVPLSDEELILKGFYPPVYDQGIPSGEWARNYISTYVEKDIRQIRNISDLLVFERFLALLAGRCSQELNMHALAVETGVDHKTIQAWIELLEASYILFLHRPFYKNYNKTVIKRPKLYFYDTALVCSLLRISLPEHLQSHPLRGPLFENLVVSDLFKTQKHLGKVNELYYWRDKTGHEIDIIVDQGSSLVPIEIKAAHTIPTGGFKNINWWKSLTGIQDAYLLYSGREKRVGSDGNTVVNWREFALQSNLLMNG